MQMTRFRPLQDATLRILMADAEGGQHISALLRRVRPPTDPQNIVHETTPPGVAPENNPITISKEKNLGWIK